MECKTFKRISPSVIAILTATISPQGYLLNILIQKVWREAGHLYLQNPPDHWGKCLEGIYYSELVALSLSMATVLKKIGEPYNTLRSRVCSVYSKSTIAFGFDIILTGADIISLSFLKDILTGWSILGSQGFVFCCFFFLALWLYHTTLSSLKDFC